MIFLTGLSHHTAPVAVREKVARAQDHLGDLYNQLSQDLASGLLDEGVYFFTCNRVEFLGASRNPAKARATIINRLAAAAGLAAEEFQDYLYLHQGPEAVRHIFRVAASLDSMVVGEPQILGQTKAAFKLANKYRTTGPKINKLMHKSFSAAKKVRTETGLACRAVSVAYAAVELARQKLGYLRNKQVLLLGAGEMAELVAQHLKAQNGVSLFVASRTLEKAREVASCYGGQAISWSKLELLLAEVDIVIGSTGATRPVLTRELLAPIMAGRPEKSMFLVDIAVPRDIEPEVGLLPGVTLQDIDSLKEVADRNRKIREKEALKAETLIMREQERYLAWLESLACWPTITALTRKAEELRQLELCRTLPKLNLNPAQRAAIEIMTSSMMKKIIHGPITFIKKSGRHGLLESNLYLARRVLGLDDPDNGEADEASAEPKAVWKNEPKTPSPPAPPAAADSAERLLSAKPFSSGGDRLPASVPMETEHETW